MVAAVYWGPFFVTNKSNFFLSTTNKIIHVSIALELLETNAKQRCNYFSSRKKQMTAKFIKKSQKIPGAKIANFGGRNSKK
jgi:hypothetical protein